MKRQLLLFLLGLLCSDWSVGGARCWAGPEIPGAAPTGPVALVNATLHPVSGPDLPGATLVFQQGKLLALGADVAPPADAQRIDLAGLHVYPGLIDAASDLGLVEIPSVRATRDAAETGPLNPNVHAYLAFNPDSELLPVTRANGILAALVVPRGEAVLGQSSLMLLDGWSWEDMALSTDVALHVRWPRVAPVALRFPGPSTEGPESIVGETAQRLKWTARFREQLAEARAYALAWQAHRDAQADRPAYDARLEALVAVVAGQRPLVIQADQRQQIQEALEFCKAQGLRMIIQGGYEAPACAAELLAQHVPVIVAGVQRLPQNIDDAYDSPYTVAARLHQQQVQFCIAGAVEASQARNLPYQAATAAAYGLPAEAALRAITLWPAQILGAGDRLGSLEVGKDATLIVTTGDPLETPTQVVRAFVQGRDVDLSNRQTRLYAKYREKLRRDQAAAPP